MRHASREQATMASFRFWPVIGTSAYSVPASNGNLRRDFDFCIFTPLTLKAIKERDKRTQFCISVDQNVLPRIRTRAKEQIPHDQKKLSTLSLDPRCRSFHGSSSSHPLLSVAAIRFRPHRRHLTNRRKLAPDDSQGNKAVETKGLTHPPCPSCIRLHHFLQSIPSFLAPISHFSTFFSQPTHSMFLQFPNQHQILVR